jgi:cell division topological specificity factor
MNLINLFYRRRSANVARDRLQILLAHERSSSGRPDLVSVLREEILAVIAKHVPVARDKVHVKVDHGRAVSTLEVEIEIPTNAQPRRELALS